MERMFDERLRERAARATVVAHYTDQETLFSHILPKMTLKLGRLSNTNDPRETKEWAFPSIKSETADVISRHEQANKRLNEVLRNRAYVACGTRDQHANKFDCYLRPRMWAQYGDRHRGACLVIDAEALTSEIEHAFPNDQVRSEPIDYSDDMPFETPVKFTDPFHNSVDEFIKNQERYFLLQKHPDWKDENEHRWIVIADVARDDNRYVSLEHSLLAVVLGVDCPRLNALIDIFPKSSDVLIGKMEWIFMDHPSVKYW